MFRGLVISCTLGAAIAGGVIYYVGLPQEPAAPRTSTPPPGVKVVNAAPNAPAGQEIGGPLYVIAGADQQAASFAPLTGNKIVIPEARFQPENTEDVPSQKDGVLQFIGTELDRTKPIPDRDKGLYFAEKVPFIARQMGDSEKFPEGQKVLEREEGDLKYFSILQRPDPSAPDQTPALIDFYMRKDGKDTKVYRRIEKSEELRPNRVIFGLETRWFRQLRPGDQIKKGQLLALLDPSLAFDEVSTRVKKFDGKEADRISSEKTRDEAQERVNTNTRLQRQGSIVPPEEVRGAVLTWQRYVYEEITKRGEVQIAERELAQALTILRQHEIRSQIDGDVKLVFKYKGESVKSLDPVFQIHDPEHLRIEGRVGVQNRPSLLPGTEVVIEPSVQERNVQDFGAHLNEVTAVAVSNDKDNPLILSASEDGTILVWDRAKGRDGKLAWWDHAPADLKYRYVHPSAVKCLACTPPGSAAHLCLSGDVDGTGRLWDLTRDASQAPRLLATKHRGPVNAVAFSPDGKYCATAGEDRRICLWETNGTYLYTFPAGHVGAVTSIQFTPRSQLVSAGKDNALMLWTLGKGGARLEATRFDRRGGEVTSLGLSPNGREILFDRGRELRILALDGGRSEGVLENPPGAANFREFALFSPDGKLALTANGTENQVQLWRLPTTTSRAYELRQFVWSKSPTTAAAFYPYPETGLGFVVTGTKEGSLAIWKLPSDKEISEQVKGEITFVGESLESSARQVPVWAKVTSNPGRPLITGNTGTIVLYPK